MIRELHAQKLTVLEIKEHLAAGNTSTGQIVNITRDGLYNVLRKLKVKAHRSSYYGSLRENADELNRAGRSLQWIAQHFNQRRFASASGKSWTPMMVFGLHRAVGGETELLENIHRAVIADALRRGLSFREMAAEFEEKKIRRRGRPLWTAAI